MVAAKQRSKKSKESTGIQDAHDNLWRSPLVRWCVFSAVVIWLAFPPVGLWPLAWFALVGWIRVIQMPELPRPRPYAMIYLVGYCHWLLMTQWVRLPHWAAGIGWLFLAAYLAIYVPLFIALSRWLVHRAKVSCVLAAPLVWVALEMVRAFAFTGWALCMLSHTQVRFIPVLQIASWTGAYGVSFLLVMTAAMVEPLVGWRYSPAVKSSRLLVSCGATIVISLMTFGHYVSTVGTTPSQTHANVALIQGSIDTVFDDGKENDKRREQSFAYYFDASIRAVLESRDIDLVIWPESMFNLVGGRSIMTYEADVPIPKHWQREQEGNSPEMTFERAAGIFAGNAADVVIPIGTKCLVGTSTTHYTQDGELLYNTAALFQADGTLECTYHKMHPVMFGEYIPLGDVFPWLYAPMPIDSGLARGTGPVAMRAGQLVFSPSICFENTVPHLIRRQLLKLESQGQPVDALVTMTNDGWFWGSSLLDLHLACGIFRAVENGRPALICANTGISAQIDRYGRVLQRGPRRKKKVLVANLRGSNEQLTLYTRYGDWFPLTCALLVCGLAWRGWSRQSTETSVT